MKFGFPPVLLVAIVFIGTMATAVLTEGKVDYKDIANTALSGYLGYLKGKDDNDA